MFLGIKNRIRENGVFLTKTVSLEYFSKFGTYVAEQSHFIKREVKINFLFRDFALEDIAFKICRLAKKIIFRTV